MTRYLPAAKEDLVEAAKFYEKREPGLGDSFLDEIEICLARIHQQPLLGEAVIPELRRRLLRRFPFSIIYALEDDVLIVVAVAHTSRKPGYWRSRLDEA